MVGQHCSCNGYPGVVSKVCTGQLDGMVEVRLDSGMVCVDASELKVPVYRNAAFKKRDYEATNIAACSIIDKGAKVPAGYEPVKADFVANMTPLWIEAGVQYWGWL
jgi:hypothetical protein